MNFSNTVKVIFIISTAFAGMVACSVKDNLDDMHDKTDQLASTSDQLSAKMSKSNETSSHLEELTETLAFGGRTDATARTRESALDYLSKAKDMPEKLAMAGKFYYSQEFQSYYAMGLDDPTELDALKKRAVEELYERVQTYYTPPQHFWEAWLPLDDHLLDIYAVSAPLHYLLPEQKARALKHGFVPVTFLSLVEEALLELHNNSTRDPRTLPTWMYLIQKYSDISIDLLKARVTYLPFQRYAEDVELNKKSKVEQFVQARHDQKQWILHAYDMNLATIARGSEYLEYALQTRKFLADIGVESNLDDTEKRSLKIRTIYQNMTIAIPLSETRTPLMLAQDSEVAHFQYLVQLLLAPVSDFVKAGPRTYAPRPQ